MATQVLTDAFFSFTAVDLSDHTVGVSSNYMAELLDDTAMGDTTRSRIGGLKDWEFTVTLHADEASSSVHQTLFPLVGTTGTVIFRPVNTGGVGATNPNYTGTAILENCPPLTGNVGELHTISVTFRAAGALSRATL